jgi:hypothetical protein
MPGSPFDYKSNDLGLIYVPPASEADPRVPIAEEFSLAEKIRMYLYASGRNEGWDQNPEITVTSPRTVGIKGELSLGVYPNKLPIDTSLVLPALTQTGIFIGRDYLSVVSFAAEVGEQQDAILGTVAFEYSVINEATINGIQKENARRLRAFWIIVSSPNPLTETDIWDSLTVVGNTKIIAIANKDDTGFILGTTTTRVYALDPNLVVDSYVAIENSLKIAPICSVRRSLNYQEEGYTYGYNAEDPITLSDIQLLAKRNKYLDPQSESIKAIREIVLGKLRKGAIKKKAVLNLSPGQAPNNPGRSGIPVTSPNGSVCASNDQRIFMTNQTILQKLAATFVTANQDGFGQSLVGVGLNTNSPPGTLFSENREDHKIYALNGTEQSSLGSFTNLGGNGSLQWVRRDNSTILPGDVVVVVPGVRYPAGSGLSIPFLTIEKAWRDGVEISAANIRSGMDNDLSAYEAPSNSESFIVIYGTERAAIHYIYKKITVTSDASGIAVIPNTEKGCFAFMQGVITSNDNRIDAPVVAGLSPSTSYDALCYYPPRSSEIWQFQITYPVYEGLAQLQPDFLDEATIISDPICFLHTSGGGLSVHRGDSELAERPISFHLPKKTEGIQDYEFNAPIFFPNEPYPDDVSWRRVDLLTSPGLAFPTPGQKISFTASNGILPRSINGKLSVDGKTMGVKIFPINNEASFQAVIAFSVEKDGERRMVIATQNCSDYSPVNIEFDSATPTAFDLFEL